MEIVSSIFLIAFLVGFGFLVWRYMKISYDNAVREKEMIRKQSAFYDIAGEWFARELNKE